MRIHTNTLTLDQIRETLTTEKSRGRIGQSVYFDVLTGHGSRSHKVAFEIQLKAGSHDAPDTPNRRWANSGGYGASGDYAATYDEWGWLLAELYRIDPEMVVGIIKHPIYRNAEHFHTQTGLTYDPDELIHRIEYDGGDPYPYVSGKGASSKKGYEVGRRGVGRYASSTWYGTVYKPRTAEEVRAYARLEGQ